MDFETLHPAEQLVMLMSRIYGRGMTTTSGGNLSVADAGGNIWITPKAVDKGTLKRGDIICAKPDGSCTGPYEPSSELPFHRAIYGVRPDIRAVAHAHPAGAVAFSMVRRLPDTRMLPSVYQACGGLSAADYAAPGSLKLRDSVERCFAQGADVVMMDNHGVCAGADSIFAAYEKLETIEYCAQLELTARRLGTVRQLTDAQLAAAETSDNTQMEQFDIKERPEAEAAARRDIAALIRRAYAQGLFSSTGGTCSVRVGDSFVITPHGRDRAYLTEEDMVTVRGGRREAGKLPSRSVRLHELIYAANHDVNAILMAHPLHLMAFAVTDAPLDTMCIPESYVMLRNTRKLPFEALYAHTEETARLFCRTTPGILAENDCAVMTGGTLIEAFDRLEVAELTARALILSKSLGDTVHITSDEAAELNRVYGLG